MAKGKIDLMVISKALKRFGCGRVRGMRTDDLEGDNIMDRHEIVFMDAKTSCPKRRTPRSSLGVPIHCLQAPRSRA